MVEERRNAEFADFFNRMQLEDDHDNSNTHPLVLSESNPESMHVAGEMQALVPSQPRHSGSSGADQAMSSGPTAPTIPPASTIPAVAPVNAIPDSNAVDRSLPAVAAPSKSKARPKPKPKKKAQTIETPQVGVDGRAIGDDDFVGNDEVAAGGQPARKATRNRKGKSRAE